MTIRYLKYFIIIILIVGLGSWFLFPTDEDEQAPAYDVTEVKRGDLKAIVSATGTLNPVITVQVGSQVSGTIQTLNVDFNSRVKKGQVIAKIDSAIFDARLAEANSNLKSAQASRDKAWVEVLDAGHHARRRISAAPNRTREDQPAVSPPHHRIRQAFRCARCAQHQLQHHG